MFSTCAFPKAGSSLSSTHVDDPSGSNFCRAKGRHSVITAPGLHFSDIIVHVLRNRRSDQGSIWVEDQSTGHELQMVSLDVCRAYRETSVVRLNVTWLTPTTTWKRPMNRRRRIEKGPASTDGSDGSGNSCARVVLSRVPAMQVKELAWERSARYLRFFSRSVLSRHVETLCFTGLFNDDLSRVMWPAGIKCLVLGECYNQPLADIEFPPNIEDMVFGHDFDQRLDGIIWPTGLKRLRFGNNFNQPLESVSSWPETLTSVTFGNAFNQDIVRVAWPAGLKELEFSESFDHTLVGVTWPCALEDLRIQGQFNQPLSGISWSSSAGLHTIILNARFNHPIDEVRALAPQLVHGVDDGVPVRFADKTVRPVALLWA